MLHELLESRAKPQRTGWGMATSVVMHGALVSLAVVATLREVRAEKPAPPETVDIVYPPSPPAEVVHHAGSAAPGAASAPPTAPIPPLPVVGEISATIPPPGPAIDQTVYDAWDKGATRGSGDVLGAIGSAGAGVAAIDGVFDAHMVDKAVVSVGNNPMPRYPQMLRDAGVEGTVLAQFVVDTLGRADMGTFRVLSSGHDLFADAVRLTLPKMRFLPAEVNAQGARPRKVAQLVQMPFAFTIAR